MASKKGIALTAGIAAAIVGASFLIWLIPQSSPGTLIGPPRASEEIINDVYSRHQSLASDIESKFGQWQEGQLGSKDMQTVIANAIAQTTRIKSDLAAASPAQEWRKSYDLYGQALDSFKEYLNAMKTQVDNENKNQDPKLESLKAKWQGYVNDAVAAMPV